METARFFKQDFEVFFIRNFKLLVYFKTNNTFNKTRHIYIVKYVQLFFSSGKCINNHTVQYCIIVTFCLKVYIFIV